MLRPQIGVRGLPSTYEHDFLTADAVVRRLATLRNVDALPSTSSPGRLAGQVSRLPEADSGDGNRLRWRPLQGAFRVQESPRGETFWAEEDGIWLRGRTLFATSGGADVRLGRGWSATAQALVVAAEGEAVRGRLERAYLRWAGERHAWTFGRDVQRWGSGRIGSLLLGRSAPPRWQVRWNTARPLSLLFLPAAWGTWTGEVFFSHLPDEDRFIADPQLFGHRTSWQPTRWLELTATRTILLGGRGRTERLTLEDVWNILTVQNENIRGERPPGDTDQRASFEARMQIPWLAEAVDLVDAVEGFYEYGGEDVNDPPLPSAVAHHYGLSAVLRGWTLASEFAETATGSNRWYFHTIYRDAYFYQGFPLGLPQVTDARTLWFGLWSAPLGLGTRDRPWRVRLERSEQTFGVRSGERELRVQWEIGLRYDVSSGTVLELAAATTNRIGPGREARAPGYVPSQVTFRWTRDLAR